MKWKIEKGTEEDIRPLILTWPTSSQHSIEVGSGQEDLSQLIVDGVQTEEERREGVGEVWAQPYRGVLGTYEVQENKGRHVAEGPGIF